MTSREFFGYSGLRDITIKLYNEEDEIVYDSADTCWHNAHPTIKDEIETAILYYHKFWKQRGEPVKATIFTTPKWNLCTIDLRTNKKIFK